MNSQHKNVYWLASYPKSGNTWVRLFLEALYEGDNFNINNTKHTDGIFSDINLFEIETELEVENIPPTLIQKYRNIAFINFCKSQNKNLFFKIHDAYVGSSITNESIVPVSISKKAIYIVRNPLDVLLSLSNHNGQSIDKTLRKYLSNTAAHLADSQKNSGQFVQFLLDWSGHVESWVFQREIPVYVVKYEDMLAIPFDTFSKIVQELDLDFTSEQVKKAIELTKFENLKKIESEKGFKENRNPKSSFFFKGESGRWEKELSSEQIRQVREAHEKMMKYFNYW